MKLAMVHPFFDAPRGAEKLILEFVRALQGSGHQVRILAFRVEEEAFRGAIEDLQVQLLPVPRRSWTGSPDPRTLEALKTGLEDCEAAMAHNHPANAYLGLSGCPAKKVWYCHEPHRSLFPRETNPATSAALEHGRLGGSPEVARAIRSSLARSRWKRRLSPRHRGRVALDLAGVARLDAIWANSAATAAAVERIYGRKAEVFYPAVNFPASLPPRPSFDGPLRLLSLGAFGAAKGLENLLRGFALFLSRHPGAGILEVAGQGRGIQDYRRLAARLDLGDSVRFHGFLAGPELEDLRGRCHVFAGLPCDEPFGMVFPEAAGAGLLLLGSDHGGPREILEEGRVGLMADPFDPGSLAAALEKILGMTEAQRDQMRLSAFASAKVRFDAATLGARLSERFRSLVEGPAEARP